MPVSDMTGRDVPLETGDHLPLTILDWEERGRPPYIILAIEGVPTQPVMVGNISEHLAGGRRGSLQIECNPSTRKRGWVVDQVPSPGMTKSKAGMVLGYNASVINATVFTRLKEERIAALCRPSSEDQAGEARLVLTRSLSISGD